MNKRIEKEINKIYISVFNKVFNQAKRENSILDKKQISNIILRLKESNKYKLFCKKFSQELAKKGLAEQRGIWKQYYKAAKEKHIVALPSTYTEFELNQFKKAVKNNFKMIKSIPDEVMEVYKFKYVNTLVKQVAEGSIGRKTFEKELKESGSTRAKLIARTETAKLQTVIAQARSTDLGSVCYEWLSSNDKRTRPSHKRMNGVIVFWRKQEEKPILDNMQGNAGEFPNCRCAPQPIFDKDDLTKSNYEVYDYRTHTIVQMNKERLIQCIENGQII